jgi:GNAT superfamily N-acetyltransferase
MPSMDLPADWEGDLPSALLRQLYAPEELLHQDFPQLVEEYPAHLHIDLLPEYQRKGFGRQLIDMFCEKLRWDEVKGVHLIMAAENLNGMFYERLGFVRFPFVLDGGKSVEEGRHPGGIWLMKSLE